MLVESLLKNKIDKFSKSFGDFIPTSSPSLERSTPLVTSH